MNERPKLMCKVCGKTPSDLREYVSMAKEEGTTPEDFCWNNEGTLNRTTGKFYCTECYVNVGQPLGTA